MIGAAAFLAALSGCGYAGSEEIDAESAAILIPQGGRVSNVLVNVGRFCS